MDLVYVFKKSLVFIPLATLAWFLSSVIAREFGYNLGVGGVWNYIVIGTATGMLALTGGGIAGDDKAYRIFPNRPRWQSFFMGETFRLVLVFLFGVLIAVTVK